MQYGNRKTTKRQNKEMRSLNRTMQYGNAEEEEEEVEEVKV